MLAGLLLYILDIRLFIVLIVIFKKTKICFEKYHYFLFYRKFFEHSVYPT